MDGDESDININPLILLLFIFTVIITIIVVLYFTVFKCKSLDDECEEDEDCCEDLKCKENICSDNVGNTPITSGTITTNTPITSGTITTFKQSGNFIRTKDRTRNSRPT